MRDVSNTALVTLACHIQDTRRRHPILNDRSSLKALEYLNTNLGEESRKVLNKKVRKNLEKHTAIRAKQYDSYARNFLDKNPDATIINIGCGLDHRFERIDNGLCTFWDLDLPDIMQLKSRIFPPEERYRQLSQSVFETNWMDKVGDKPTLLLAEGVFMYCDEMDIKWLFTEIHHKLGGAEFVFEVFSSKWLRGWKKKMVDFKLRKQLKFGKDAGFRFGIEDSEAIEKWSLDYNFIGDWSYFDVIRPKTRDFLRKIQWTVHYKIN